MELLVERVDVWAATIADEPGGLASMLSPLRDAGADLQFIVARRAPDKPGRGVVFVTPLRGDKEIAAAADAGFNVAQTLHCVRVTGPDRPGVCAEVAGRLADASINLREFAACVIGTQFVVYIGVDSLHDATHAMQVLRDGA